MANVKTFNETILVPYTGSGRSHKLIVLPNGLLTLLVSDPAEDLASAALCVAAGAHNDPDDIAGLAHFCEHLLLLGSKNHPDSNQFHDLLSKAGGRRNAFTTGEQTCYFFEVPSDAIHKDKNTLEPMFTFLLSMFADSVKASAFPESMFEKEIYAIDNEHTANISKTGRAMYHGLRLISSPAHPFHRFATGNFFTINDVPRMKKMNVKEHLQRYYQENYVSEKMTLVIRGSQSLNLLQKLAISNFSGIQTSTERSQKKSKLKLLSNSASKSTATVELKDINDYHILSDWKYEGSAFTSQEAYNCILINTTKSPTLRLIFPSNASSHPLTSLFEKAWCNVVGDESFGSLDDVLKSKGYSNGVVAFSQHLSQDDNVLVLEIKLTNTGAKKVNDVITIVMSDFRNQVFQDTAKLAMYLFEMESIDILNYLHQDISKSPMEEVSAYAVSLQQNMFVLKPKNILKGSVNWDSLSNIDTPEGYKYWTQRALELQEYINQTFSIHNMRFIIMSDPKLTYSLDNAITVSSEESDQYFNFDYRLAKFNPRSFAKSLDTQFKMVRCNKFIPKYALDHKQLRTLLQDCSEKSSMASLGYSTKSAWSATKAELVHKSGSFELWTKFESSKVYNSKVFLSFDIVSTNVEASPLNTMNTEILAELLKLNVAKKLYASELLGYTWAVYASLKGDVRFGFTISGFADGVDYMLGILVDGFMSLVNHLDFNSDDFRKSRVAVRSRYGELSQDNSLAMAVTGLLVVLEEKVWTLEDRLDVLDDIDMESFKEFIDELKSSSKFLKLFVQGDFKSADHYSVTINPITRHLEKTPTSTYKEPTTILLPSGSSHFVTRGSPKGDPTNSVCFFLQTGPRNDARVMILTSILSFAMSITLVPDLRFKKQLGYVVLGGTRLMRTTMGIHITVMSATFSPQYLSHAIDEYLLSWEHNLERMDEAEFQKDVIDAYSKTVGKSMHESGGPESLTSEMVPSVGSSNSSDTGESSKSHNKLRDLIFTDNYDPKMGEYSGVFKISKREFVSFFKQRVSPSSQSRAQMLVMIKSSLSPEESRQQLMRLQLEAFLKMNGLRISPDKLKEFVEKSGGNPAYLMKDLFKHFMGQGESLRLCTIVLKEVFKQIGESMKHREGSGGSTGALQTQGSRGTDVGDITSFQAQLSSSHVH